MLSPKWRKRLAKIPALKFLHGKGTVVRIHWRTMLRSPIAALRFLFLDPELTNLTYEIANRDDLISFMSLHLGQPPDELRSFVEEIDGDSDLRTELTHRMEGRRFRRRVPYYGRRIGWYVIVRATKPRIVVETGVHDGLGSAVLLAALARNEAEGSPGRLIGFDIDPTSGWLIPPSLRGNIYDLVIKPSLVGLAELEPHSIDFLIHDSDHANDYEVNEYAAALPELSERSIVISDNAHVTDALERFAKRSNRQYSFWHEEPQDHFYPGGGIGLAMPSAVLPK